jgi:hypothetical protein
MNTKINGKGMNSIYNTTPVTSSGTTSQVIMQSLLVPGGTYTSGDLIQIASLFSKTGISGTQTYRFWVNTSVSVTGAIQITQRNTLTGFLFIFFSRHLFIYEQTGTGTGNLQGTETQSNTSSIISEYNRSQKTNSNINWANDVYIFATCQLTRSSDSISQIYMKIWEY